MDPVILNGKPPKQFAVKHFKKKKQMYENFHNTKKSQAGLLILEPLTTN